MRVLGGFIAVLLLVACGPKTMEARLRDAEKLADRAGVHLDEAEKAMGALEPVKMEAALSDAKRVLAEKDIELYPDAQMHLDRYKELEARLAAVKADREKRDLERRLNAARDKIVPRVQALLEAQEALLPNAPTRAGVETLESRTRAVKDAVDEDLELFVKDADFAAWAKSQRSKVDKAQELTFRAKKGLGFLEGPVVDWQEGLKLQKEARARKTPANKEPFLRDARTRLSACDRNARSFSEDKATAAVAFGMPSGKPLTPTQLQSTCQKVLPAVDREWQRVLAQLKKKKR